MMAATMVKNMITNMNVFKTMNIAYVAEIKQN